MSWADLVGDQRPVLRDSPLEAARFGRSVSRMLIAAEAVVDESWLVQTLAGCDADVIVLRYPAAQVGRFAALIRTGRTVVHADHLVYWRLRVGHGRRPATQPGLEAGGLDQLDPAAARALVDDLVAEIFAGYGNHYLANPLFDPAAALAGYQEWARTMVGVHAAGDGIVLHAEGEPIGLATTTAAEAIREIELAGVRPAWQRGGRYAHVLAAVEDLASRRGETDIVISTQGHNTDVQRAWARYGFEPVGAWTTVHLVKPHLLALA